MHVLVVDDDAPLRRALGRTLRDLGLRPVEAATGPAALAMLSLNTRIVLVVLDLHIPHPDGIAVLEAIRSTAGLDHVKVLMCTCADDLTSILLALTAGADGYLVKPVAPADLRERLGLLGIDPR